MTQVHILVGSMLGGTEYVADCLAEDLNQAGFSAQVHLDFDDIQSLIGDQSIWLICSSTHGAGDLPDNIQPLASFLQQQPDLSMIRYGLIGIGDCNYDTFNQAAKTLAELMNNTQAQILGQPLFIDVQADQLPEEPAQAWLKVWIEQELTK